LDEFPYVMIEELLDELPPKKKTSWPCNRSDVKNGTSRQGPIYIEWVMKSWKNLRFNLKNFSQRDTSNLASHHIGHLSSLFTRRTGCWKCVWIIEPSTKWQWRIDIHYLELMICSIDYRKLKCLIGLTYIWGITKFKL
jgi:hypothetical protein